MVPPRRVGLLLLAALVSCGGSEEPIGARLEMELSSAATSGAAGSAAASARRRAEVLRGVLIECLWSV